MGIGIFPVYSDLFLKKIFLTFELAPLDLLFFKKILIFALDGFSVKALDCILYKDTIFLILMVEAIMTIEDHNNSNSNVSASKKLKQNRVPQRGLGVAQLERIRLEEQQIKDEILTPNPVVSSKDSTFRALKPASSVLKNCDFRLNSSTPFVDNLSPKKGLQSPKQVNVSEGEMNLSAAVLGKGCDDVSSKLCSGKCSSEKDHDEKLYHHGVVIQPPIFSSPQYQQPVCSSSMVSHLTCHFF